MPAYNRYYAHLSLFLAKGYTNIIVFWKILIKYIPRHSLGDRCNTAHSNFQPKYPAQKSCCPRPNLRSANVSLPKPKKRQHKSWAPQAVCTSASCAATICATLHIMKMSTTVQSAKFFSDLRSYIFLVSTFFLAFSSHYAWTRFYCIHCGASEKNLGM